MGVKVITLVNEKGGVGKTTLGVHLAAGMAYSGYRVLLIDADPQGHATVMCGIAKAPGLYDLLVRDAPFPDVIRLVSPAIYDMPDVTEAMGRLYIGGTGKLYLVPGNVETRLIASAVDNAFIVADVLEPLEGNIDLVVIDTSPTPSLLHGSIYLATDAILYPTTCDYLGFDGLVESIQHRLEADEKRRSHHKQPITMLGIVPTLFRASTLEDTETLQTLQERYGDLVWPPIPQRTVWKEAARVHQMVWTLAPASEAASEARLFLDTFGERQRHVTP